MVRLARVSCFVGKLVKLDTKYGTTRGENVDSNHNHYQPFILHPLALNAKYPYLNIIYIDYIMSTAFCKTDSSVSRFYLNENMSAISWMLY